MSLSSGRMSHVCSLLPNAVWKALVLMRSSRAGKLGCQSKVWHCGIQHWGYGNYSQLPTHASEIHACVGVLKCFKWSRPYQYAKAGQAEVSLCADR